MKFISLLLMFASASCACGQQANPEESGSMSGRIYDVANQPVAANVTVYGRTITNGRLDLFAMCSRHTDENGLYQCPRLRPGEYIVMALPQVDEQNAASHAVGANFGMTFSPGTTDFQSATRVRVAAKQGTTADVLVRIPKVGTIRSTLVLRPAHVSFRVTQKIGTIELPIHAVSQYDPGTGELSFDTLPEGSYMIHAAVLTEKTTQESVASGTVTGGRTTTVHFSPENRRSVTGKLVFAESTPTTHLPKTVRMEGVGERAGWSLDQPVASDGSFSFPMLLPGDYVVRIPEPGSYISTVTQGQRRGAGDLIHVADSSGALKVECEVATTRSVLAGSMKGERIAGRSSVVLVSDTDGGVLVAPVSSDGRFRIDSLPPGGYRLFAVRDTSTFEFRNPEVLRQWNRFATTVSVNNDQPVQNVDVEAMAF